MGIFRKLRDALKPKPASPEELAEAQRLRGELETQRLSQRSQAGQNYESGRGS
jgi:hypothetical protein